MRFFIFLFLIILSPLAIAGPMPLQDIIFSFETNESNATFYFISVGEFEKDGWNFQDYNIKENYLKLKKECGKENTFREIVYEMSADERLHKGCVINGTYQEVYCFKTITDKKECEALIPYKIENNMLNFGAYYNSLMFDINRSDFYNHFDASKCEVINKTCTFTIHKKSKPYNPYIIVLEKEDSIYFSDEINITQTNLFYNKNIFPNDEITYHVEKEVNLALKEFEIKDNKLKITFETKKENNLFKRLAAWIKNLFK